MEHLVTLSPEQLSLARVFIGSALFLAMLVLLFESYYRVTKPPARPGRPPKK